MDILKDQNHEAAFRANSTCFNTIMIKEIYVVSAILELIMNNE